MFRNGIVHIKYFLHEYTKRNPFTSTWIGMKLIFLKCTIFQNEGFLNDQINETSCVYSV